MADLKISGAPAVVTPAGTDEYATNQAGVSKKTTLAQILGEVPAGGDVFKVGTPADNQLGVWTGDGTIEGTDQFQVVASALQGVLGSGPEMRNVAGVNIHPRKGDTDTGIASRGDNRLAMVAQGIDGIKLIGASSAILQQHNTTVGLTAFAGGGQGSATQLNSSYSVVDTVATAGDSVKFSTTLEVGVVNYVKNDGANALDLFPAGGDDLGLGIGVAISVGAGKSVAFIGTVTGSVSTQFIFQEESNVVSGGLLTAEYRFSTTITAADPGPGRFRYNNATPASVTEIFIDDFSNAGIDISNLLSLITTGDRLYFQTETDGSDFLVFNVSAPITDNTGWFTIAGTVEASGNLHDNNDACLAALQIGGAAGFVEVNDLTAAVVWDDIPDANVPESAVTQHEAALTILESQISDLQSYLLPADIGVSVQGFDANTAFTDVAETVSNTWTRLDNVGLNFGTGNDWSLFFNGGDLQLIAAAAADPTSFQIFDAGGLKWELDHGNDRMWLRDGYVFRISSSDDTDFAEFSHDLTDFATAFTATVDWNITGLSGRIKQGAETLAFLSEVGGVTFPEFQFGGSDLLNPNSADWAVNALAPVQADNINAGLSVRRFDDTDEEGVGFLLEVPAGATNIVFGFTSRAVSPQPTLNTIGVNVYNRGMPDDGAVQAWSAGDQLTDLDLPNSTNFVKDSESVTLASLGITAGEVTQFEITRVAPAGDDQVGDWAVLQIRVTFT